MALYRQIDAFEDRPEAEGLTTGSESRVVQSAREEADINTIVKRFGLTGQLPSNVRVPLQEDFIDVMDFHSAMNAIKVANEAFYAMPAFIRERFGNDAGLFSDFCTAEGVDPVTGEVVLKNLEEMRKLGLAVPKVETAPALPEVPKVETAPAVPAKPAVPVIT